MCAQTPSALTALSTALHRPHRPHRPQRFAHPAPTLCPQRFAPSLPPPLLSESFFKKYLEAPMRAQTPPPSPPLHRPYRPLAPLQKFTGLQRAPKPPPPSPPHNPHRLQPTLPPLYALTVVTAPTTPSELLLPSLQEIIWRPPMRAQAPSALTCRSHHPHRPQRFAHTALHSHALPLSPTAAHHCASSAAPSQSLPKYFEAYALTLQSWLHPPPPPSQPLRPQSPLPTPP